MRYYLKGSSRAFFKAVDTDNFDVLDAILDHNEAIYRMLFEKLISGDIDMIYQKNPHSIVMAHRSTRKGVLVQISHAMIQEGQIIPLSHTNITSLKDFLSNTDFTECRYITTMSA